MAKRHVSIDPVHPGELLRESVIATVHHQVAWVAADLLDASGAHVDARP